MTLTADISVSRESLDVRARVEVGAGEVLAVVGPNGAGKTTLLHAIAGLVDNGGLVDAPGPVGVVFQDRRLFPHLSVRDNVRFGATNSATADAWLDHLGLRPLAAARPHELSGGQAQRVAVARALAPGPAVLLLDEPFVGLDIESAALVYTAVREFAGPQVIVSHEPRRIGAIADRVIVLEHGAAVQEGTFDELTARPRSAYVADLVGVNLLRGTVQASGEIALDAGGVLVAAETANSGRVLLTIHPRAVALYEEPPAGSPRNVVAGTVATIDRAGDRVRVTVDGPPRLVAEITPAAVGDLQLTPGRHVFAAVKATEVTVTPA